MSNRCVVACAAVIVAAVAWPGVASAAGFGPVVLGFGASYADASGSVKTHRGIDCGAQAGDRVETPLAGEVAFVGRVPAAGGSTMLAMSIDTAQGTVTLMPLESAAVGKGTHVEAGEAVGAVAGGGDGSSEGAHLHVGLKRGGMYLDPSALIVAAPPTSSGAPDAGPSPVGASDARPRQQTGVRVATVPQALGEGVSVAPAPTAAANAPTGATATRASGTQALSVKAELPQGVSVVSEGSSTQPAQGVAVQRPAALLADGVAAGVMAAGRSLAATGGAGVAGLAAAIAAASLLLGRRAFERRMNAERPVSHRWATLLRQLRAGDTLRGLTSCPGPLPSQSRGRLAQRR